MYSEILRQAREEISMHLCISCLKWLVVWMLWSGGAFLLWEAWQYQKALDDPLGSLIEFAIMFFATCYLFAFIPIKCGVDKFLGGLKEASKAFPH